MLSVPLANAARFVIASIRRSFITRTPRMRLLVGQQPPTLWPLIHRLNSYVFGFHHLMTFSLPHRRLHLRLPRQCLRHKGCTWR